MFTEQQCKQIAAQHGLDWTALITKGLPELISILQMVAQLAQQKAGSGSASNFPGT